MTKKKNTINHTQKNTPKVSPLAPDHFPTMLPVPGVHLGAVAAGLKYTGRPDLMLAVFTEGSQAAGVYTKSKTPGAPVDWTKAALDDSGGRARCLLVNAGNANAFTGKKGNKTTMEVASALAKLTNCNKNEVLQASTGVIGEILPAAPLIKNAKLMVNGLSATLWLDAAKSITTTDTFPKGASVVTSIGGVPVTITAIAKGSGMVAPDMATMLGFIFTNANLSAACLQSILSELTDKSFNAITVDSDTSTSDMVLAIATGRQANPDQITDPNAPELDSFKNKLQAVLLDLAHQVVKDGEGARKFIEIQISGAENDTAAKIIAKSVANSPLVKTAIAGEDPNWGRIIMAVGKSGEKVDRDQIKLWIGDQLVAHNGLVHNRYNEAEAKSYMKQPTIVLKIDAGTGGDGLATVWTCDLTHDYISINADYRS